MCRLVIGTPSSHCIANVAASEFDLCIITHFVDIVEVVVVVDVVNAVVMVVVVVVRGFCVSLL